MRPWILTLGLGLGAITRGGAAHAEPPTDLAPDGGLGAALSAPTGAPLEIEDVPLESLLDLDVNAATKRTTSIAEAPTTASVVTDDQIRDYAWRSLDEVLYQEPGFARCQDSERKTVAARGQFEQWNNNRLLLLVDGVSHNDVEAGAAWTWDATPLFFVKQVEALRGPASAIYGSNAMNGVVAVRTLSARDLGDGGLRARTQLGLHTRSLDVVGAERAAGADAVIGFDASRHHDDYLDHDGSGRTDAAGRLARFTVHDQTSATYLWLKVDATGVLDGLSVQLHQQEAETTTDHGWYYWIPDHADSFHDDRTLVDLTYHARRGRVSIEEAAQFQRQAYALVARLYPAGALDGTYPDGVTESMQTHFDQVFLRSQAEVDLGREASALAGLEYSGMLYQGDDEHYANVDINDPSAPAGVGPYALGPIYEPILDRPVSRLGAFAQALSGDWLGEQVHLTAGLRFDDMFFRYRDLTTRLDHAGGFRQLSPRLGLVVTPTDALSLKLLAGHAFRTPTPIELFASNSLTAASNLGALQPEQSTTYEAAVDWAPLAALRWRSNAFWNHDDHQIGYDATEALVNLLSNERVGLESEVLVEAPAGSLRVDGFASYSYVRLVEETALGDGVTPASHLVWSPAHLVKLGARLRAPRWGASVQAYAQSKTFRRTSDRLTAAFRTTRPQSVAAFVTLAASAWWNVTSGARLGLDATNLLDSGARLIAPVDVGYDYPVAGREAMLDLQLDW